MSTREPEIDVTALTAAIHEHQRSNPDEFVYALAYGVAYPQLYGELRAWLGQGASDERLSLIFDASSEDGASQYGPFVVRLTAGADKPSKLMARLAQCAIDDFRGMSFLFSRLSIDELADSLRERLDVVCEDRSEWQMKFFDTRTLPVLERILTAEQRRLYFGLVWQWWYVDRFASLQKFAVSNEVGDIYHGPLQLTEQQSVAFIDAGLPDSVLYSLALSDDDLLGQFDALTQYRICERSLADASAEELNSMLKLSNRVRLALLNKLEQEGLVCP